MLSGIGPADELSALGIDVRLDQPAVGGNLQDHLNAGIILFTDDPTTLETAETEENVALLQTQGRGPLTSNIAESGGFWRTRDGIDAPDIQFHFAPVMFADEGLMDPFDHAYSYGACVVKPTARGRVSLRSADPADKPKILHNFLGTEEDWAVQVAGIRKCLEIREQSPLKGYERGPYEVPDGDDDEAIRAHVRAKGHHLYHPVGTCAMGSVVDAELRVQGIDGLRVVDASVMPTLTRGNTNAPTIMIAEKAADLVRGTVRGAGGGCRRLGASEGDHGPRHRGEGHGEERADEAGDDAACREREQDHHRVQLELAADEHGLQHVAVELLHDEDPDRHDRRGKTALGHERDEHRREPDDDRADDREERGHEGEDGERHRERHAEHEQRAADQQRVDQRHERDPLHVAGEHAPDALAELLRRRPVAAEQPGDPASTSAARP